MEKVSSYKIIDSNKLKDQVDKFAKKIIIHCKNIKTTVFSNEPVDNNEPSLFHINTPN
jgi:hypothetical protein